MVHDTNDSRKIISQYIAEQLDLPNLLSLDKFVSLFPSGTSIDLIKSIYTQLALQQKQKLSNTKSDIDQFNIPLEDIQDNAGHFSAINQSKVDLLNHSLAKLNLQMEYEHAIQTEEIRKELSKLDAVLENLDHIVIPKHLDREIQDAISKCDKINSINQI